MELVNKEKLLAVIEKIGKAPWEKGEGVEKLIPLSAVILAIKSPAQGVSPAELAKEIEEDRRKAEAWKKLYNLVAEWSRTMSKKSVYKFAYPVDKEEMDKLLAQFLPKAEEEKL